MGVLVVEGRQVTAGVAATGHRDISVKLDDVLAACALMQAVHILCDEKKLLRRTQLSFCFRKRQVRRVGNGCANRCAHLAKQLPSPLRLLGQAVGVAVFLDVVFLPHTVRTSIGA